MTDIDPRLGYKFFQMRLHRVDGLHAVVDVKDLPAALQFAQNGLPHQARGIRPYMRDDGQTFLGRRI